MSESKTTTPETAVPAKSLNYDVVKVVNGRFGVKILRHKTEGFNLLSIFRRGRPSRLVPERAINWTNPALKGKTLDDIAQMASHTGYVQMVPRETPVAAAA